MLVDTSRSCVLTGGVRGVEKPKGPRSPSGFRPSTSHPRAPRRRRRRPGPSSRGQRGALSAHLLDCPGCYVRLKAGDDIVAACQPFAQDIGEHATRLGLDDADRCPRGSIALYNAFLTLARCSALDADSSRSPP